MKILKHPLDKILDDIPGGSAESIPGNRGITRRQDMELTMDVD